jgi:hypothetical protein
MGPTDRFTSAQSPVILERKTGFEPATLSLARWDDWSHWFRRVHLRATPSTTRPSDSLQYAPVVERSATGQFPAGQRHIANETVATYADDRASKQSGT